MKAGRERGRTAALAMATTGRAAKCGSTTAQRGAQRLVGSLLFARRRAGSLTRSRPSATGTALPLYREAMRKTSQHTDTEEPEN